MLETSISKNDKVKRAMKESLKMFPIDRIRQDFPVLKQQFYGKPFIYLDNAATTQKPQQVIDCLTRYYEAENANIHRGVYALSENATINFEKVRDKVRLFLGAEKIEEIVFVRGATEGINLVAQSYGAKVLEPGDEIILSTMEHHSNIVPWQMICEVTGAKIRVAPINDRGEIILEEYQKLLNEKTKIVGLVHMSNALGTINPIKEMIQMAHHVGARVLVDGAQAVSHLEVDVKDLDCDFYVFSGHKIFAPTGIGVLYGKEELFETMPPYQGGGDMIRSVTFEKTIYNHLPQKFEAGTPHIAGVMGLGQALDYVQAIGLNVIAGYEEELLEFATEKISQVPGVKLVGTAKEKSSVLSFVFGEIHPHDIGTILDREGVAIRAGHHCAQPVMHRFGVSATVRASISLYNTKDEIQVFINALNKVVEVFQ